MTASVRYPFWKFRLERFKLHLHMKHWEAKSQPIFPFRSFLFRSIWNCATASSIAHREFLMVHDSPRMEIVTRMDMNQWQTMILSNDLRKITQYSTPFHMNYIFATGLHGFDPSHQSKKTPCVTAGVVSSRWGIMRKTPSFETGNKHKLATL